MTRNNLIRIAVYSLDLPHYACAELRTIAPYRQLRHRLTYKWAVRDLDDGSWIDVQPIDWADLIVIQRYFPLLETQPILQRMLDSGKPIVYEIDDLLFDVPLSHPLYQNFQRTVPHIRDLLPKVNLVTVTTDALGERIREFNPNVITIPNFLDESAIKRPGLSSDPLKTVIAFMGTPSHTPDLELIEEVLFKLHDKHKSAVQFIFWGCSGTRLEKLGRIVPFDDCYASFLANLSNTHFDIGLAPLADNPFNRCKSNIKWLEYSAFGRAGIYSNLEPYSGSVEHGKTGILAGTDPNDWLDALEYLIRHPAERQAMGRAARKDVFTRFGLSQNAHRFLNAYSKLLCR